MNIATDKTSEPVRRAPGVFTRPVLPPAILLSTWRERTALLVVEVTVLRWIVATIQELAGHQHLSTTMRYMHRRANARSGCSTAAKVTAQ